MIDREHFPIRRRAFEYRACVPGRSESRIDETAARQWFQKLDDFVEQNGRVRIHAFLYS